MDYASARTDHTSLHRRLPHAVASSDAQVSSGHLSDDFPIGAQYELCRITLRHEGESEQPITVALFDSKDEAMREAQFRAERLQVPVQLLQ